MRGFFLVCDASGSVEMVFFSGDHAAKNGRAYTQLSLKICLTICF